MNSTNHIDPEDLALFALQLLSSEEAAAMRVHLEHCDECRGELAAIQGDLAIYAMTVEQHSPPAMVRERLLTQIAREPRAQSATSTLEATEMGPVTGSLAGQRGTGGRRGTGVDRPAGVQEAAQGSVVSIGQGRDGGATETRSRGRLLPWLGWGIAAALALTAGQFYRERQALHEALEVANRHTAEMQAQTAAARQLMETMSDPRAVRVTLTRSKQAPVPQGKATYLAERGSLVFVASNLEPLQPYKTYELWIIPANGHDPIPAGLFHPDKKGDASVITPDLPKGVVAKAFGVTVEDEGGSKSPTMPILLAGASGV